LLLLLGYKDEKIQDVMNHTHFAAVAPSQLHTAANNNNNNKRTALVLLLLLLVGGGGIAGNVAVGTCVFLFYHHYTYYL
jgi:hypothetical protein